MDTNASDDVGERAGRKEWVGLAVLALPTLLLSLDFSVLFLALPKLSADLHPSSVQQLWILDIYGFMTAGFLITMGTLGDRIGRRKLMMIGAAAFGVISIFAAYSKSPEMLIIYRALLGIAGATLMPSTLSLISNMFRNVQQRGTAISLWATTVMFGIAIGPVVGGLVLRSFWWGSVFLLGVPVMVLLLIAGPLLLPEYRNPNARRLDLFSVVLSLATLLPVIYGLKELAKNGWQVIPIVAVVVGVLVGVVFVRRQRRLADPHLDIRLFRRRSFSAAFGILLLGGAISGGIGYLFTQYLQLVEGKSPLGAGLWLIPYTIGMIIGSLLSPALARTIRPAYVTAGGLVISAVGFLLLTQVSASGGLALAVVGLVIVFVGIAPTWVLGTNLILGSAPPEKAGSASSISETGSELGVALGVATLGSISTLVYRMTIVDTTPAGVPSDAAGASHDTLVGAVAAVGQLPAQVGSALLRAARTAFVDGFNVAAWVGAPVAVVLAVFAVVLLRGVPPTGATDGPADESGPRAPESDAADGGGLTAVDRTT